MIDRPVFQERWPHHWLLVALTTNLALAGGLAALLGLRAPSTALRIVIVLACAGFIVLVGLALPVSWRWLHAHSGGPAWFVVPMAVVVVAPVSALVILLGEAGLDLLPVADLWQATTPILAIAGVGTLGLGLGMTLYEAPRARRAERLGRKARLASLEARLNGHFLFNTLNTIVALIPEDPEHAQDLVRDLAHLLRFALDRRDRRTIPLEQELEVVSAYLEIQAARFDRLTYAIAVPPALRWREVPPFSLQTLVENSVTHVVEARAEPTRLRITAGVVGDTLELGVWDDGPGFSLEAIPRGRGLDTLRRRLDALYRAEAALKVERREEGTLVTIRLPVSFASERRP